MAEKCASCGVQIETVFLEKINGTYLRDKKGKKKAICSACQKSESVASLKAKL
jgi:hypothetical protein